MLWKVLLILLLLNSFACGFEEGEIYNFIGHMIPHTKKKSMFVHIIVAFIYFVFRSFSATLVLSCIFTACAIAF